MDEKDLLIEALMGIKRKRTRTEFSMFDPDDPAVFDEDEMKGYQPGKGIIHIKKTTRKIFNCGHSAEVGLGHIATCRHTVCALCMGRYVLECADGGCLKRLCLVEDCHNAAHFIDGVPYCEKHSKPALVWALGSLLFLGRRKREEIANQVADNYYGRRLQIRGDK